MILLNNYLFSGDTVLKILHNYASDLQDSSEKTGNSIDAIHSRFIGRQIDILEHNDFLTSQSQRIRELYKMMAAEYPFLAFTFKGRIKSVIRAEEKFNGYIVEHVYDYYKRNGVFPETERLEKKVKNLKDLIAYRIVISMPKCHVAEGQNRQDIELDYLYRIANVMPKFLEERGFAAQIAGKADTNRSSRLSPEVAKYFRDYIENPTPIGYQSLHITVYDNISNTFIEVQLRTKDMDDYAEIGAANHQGYEKRQEEERTRRDEIPLGAYPIFDEAYERVVKLHELNLAEVDVNMFGALNNSVVNDGCGLFRGRLILPFEHLSRFQNDIID